MLYYATGGNPGTPAAAAMSAGLIGRIDGPYSNHGPVPPGTRWCIDNGAFVDKWRADVWWAYLQRRATEAATCDFATAPDVVGDCLATAVASAPWLDPMADLGYRVAYVAQDGLRADDVPWDRIAALFLGGTTAWKIGPDARVLVRAARALGKQVHMGRVNSRKRYEYARAIGCDSVDGTYLAYGPNTNLPKLLGWVAGADQPPLAEGLV